MILNVFKRVNHFPKKLLQICKESVIMEYIRSRVWVCLCGYTDLVTCAFTANNWRQRETTCLSTTCYYIVHSFNVITYAICILPFILSCRTYFCVREKKVKYLQYIQKKSYRHIIKRKKNFKFKIHFRYLLN